MIRRYVIFFLVLVISFSLVVTMLFIGRKWSYKREDIRPEYRATQVMRAWLHTRANWVSADIAAKDLIDLRRDLASDYDLIDHEIRRGVMRKLAIKYFAEGEYGNALKMHEKWAREADCLERESMFLIYLAGLASRKDWLEKRITDSPHSQDRLKAIFLKANLAWANKDYSEVLNVTACHNQEGLSERQDASVNRTFWLHFIRAKSFAELEQRDLAMKELSAQVPVDRDVWARNMPFLVHYLIEGAEIVEEAGRPLEALDLHRSIKKYLDNFELDVSWNKTRVSNEQAIRRLTNLLSLPVPTENSIRP